MPKDSYENNEIFFMYTSNKQMFSHKELIQYNDVNRKINTELIQNINSQNTASCVLH